jgi:hypothetical protein
VRRSLFTLVRNLREKARAQRWRHLPGSSGADAACVLAATRRPVPYFTGF